MGERVMSFDISVKEKGGKAPQWSLEADLDGKYTFEQLLRFTKSALITIALDVRKEEEAKGFDRNAVRRVDGRNNLPEEAVSPLGKIEYVARVDSRQIIFDTFQAILERSPVKTGEYLNSHLVSFNGKVVATNLKELEVWAASVKEFSDRDRIRFINTAPYAHKLERDGITRNKRAAVTKESSRKKSNTVKVPNGAYKLAWRSISRKYKGNSYIKFELLPANYVGIPDNLPRSKGAEQKKKYNNFNRRTYKKGGRPYLYPTILISISKAGILENKGTILQ
jgi:hypothetical protein